MAAATPMNQFSFLQLDCICAALLKSEDKEALRRLFYSVDKNDFLPPNCPSQQVLQAYVFSLYSEKDFSTLVEVLTKVQFDSKCANKMQEYWNQAHYQFSKDVKRRELNNRQKTRIREKHPPPKTICPNGATFLQIRLKNNKFLNECFKKNQIPNEAELEEISSLIKQPIEKVSNWFRDKRYRQTLNEKNRLEQERLVDFQEDDLSVDDPFISNENCPPYEQTGTASPELSYNDTQNFNYDYGYDMWSSPVQNQSPSFYIYPPVYLDN